MRSVAVCFRTATDVEVKSRLDQLLPAQREPWVCTTDAGDAVLYINVQTPGELRQLSEETDLPYPPTSAVYIDVAGRHPGDQELRRLVQALLESSEGVASDDYTRHAWTLEEIQGGATKEGHPFFDYAGWHARLSKDRE